MEDFNIDEIFISPTDSNSKTKIMIFIDKIVKIKTIIIKTNRVIWCA